MSPANRLDSSPPLAFLNGRFVPQEQAVLPLHDAGFVFGATVTDLCRTFRHRLYRWSDHLARFRHSCAACYLDPQHTDDDITARAEELVAHNARLLRPEQDLALVLFVTPGPIGYYGGLPGAVGDAAPTFGMHTFPLPLERYRRFFEKGIALVVPPTRPVPAECVDPRIKQRSRMHWWLADRQAHQIDPAALALLQDGSGFLTETAGANFLIVRSGVVLSPPGTSILEGISRQVVHELCGELGIVFADWPMTLDDAVTAEEAFLTSTPYCLAGVSSIDGQPIPWPGPITERLLEAWSEWIQVDIRGQILGDSL